MIRFRDKRAEGWLRSKASTLLEGLTGPWRGSVQDTISEGLQQGLNPRSVGLELAGRLNKATGKREGGSIHLDETGRQTLRDFEASLTKPNQSYFGFELRNKRYDRMVRRAIDTGVRLPDEKINLLINRFEGRLLKAYGDLIAQTEMLAALHRSEWLSTKEALQNSDYPEAAMTRIWKSCGDDKVRPSHKAMDGQQVVGLKQPFVSPVTGAKMMHPGDRELGAPEDEVKGCRCGIRYDVDFLYKYREN